MENKSDKNLLEGEQNVNTERRRPQQKETREQETEPQQKETTEQETEPQAEEEIDRDSESFEDFRDSLSSEILEEKKVSVTCPVEVEYKKTMERDKFKVELALKLIDQFDGQGPVSAVEDFNTAVKYYEESLAPTEINKLIDFIIRVKLKGEARELFIEKPASIEILCKTLSDRFKPGESVGQIRLQMSKTVQENRSVDVYGKELEALSHKMVQLNMATRKVGELATVKSVIEEEALDGFISGLKTELKSAVIASQVKTLRAAIRVAQVAETANREREASVCTVKVETPRAFIRNPVNYTANRDNDYRRFNNYYRGNNRRVQYTPQPRYPVYRPPIQQYMRGTTRPQFRRPQINNVNYNNSSYDNNETEDVEFFREQPE